jgi:proline racemase
MAMRMTRVVVSLLLPGSVLAQGMGEMDQQHMMQQMQKMQECMQSIDQSEMKALEVRGNQMNAEVKALCAAGKRDEAEAKAIAFGQETAQSDALKKMAECGKGMEGMVPTPAVQPPPSQDGTPPRHVCDER